MSVDDDTKGMEDADLAEKQLLEEAKRRFQQCVENDVDVRSEYLKDLRFRVGDQWPEGIETSREKDNRPSLVINRLPQFTRQVTNDARQNKPGLKVAPVEDGDVEVAEIYNGLIRHIEQASDAQIAYDTAIDSQVTGGFGYFRLLTEYCTDEGFDQEIKIKRILNALTVYFDPNAQEPDYSDARFAFIVEDMTSDAFKLAYPKSKLSSMADFSAIGDDVFIQGDTMRVAEYFKVVMEDSKLYLLEDGQIVDKVPEGMKALKERVVSIPTVKWYKISATEILEESVWPGKWIPIIPVLGEEHIVNGKRILVGLIRYARDPQSMLNYWVSAQTEAIALAPKAPWLMAEGQDEGYKHLWENANRDNQSRLIYKPTSLNGTTLPAPHRLTAEPPVQAMMNATNMAGQFLKDTTGIYDASLGAHGNETSGRAILARQKEGDVSTFHFIDNFSRSIKHMGRQLVDLIPKIYDAPRIIRIVGENGDEKMVPVNQPIDGQVAKIFDLTTGKYDVVLESGPSYSTKREQSAQMMLDISNSYPQLWQVAGDILVKSFDWPGAAELSNRLKLLLPPQVQQQSDGKPAIPPQIKAQMQQMTQMMDALTKELHDAATEVEKLKAQENIKVMEIESRERIATMQSEVDLLKTQASLEHKGHLTAFVQELDLLKKRMAIMSDHTYQANEHAQQQAMVPEPQETPSSEGQEPMPDAEPAAVS